MAGRPDQPASWPPTPTKLAERVGRVWEARWSGEPSPTLNTPHTMCFAVKSKSIQEITTAQPGQTRPTGHGQGLSRGPCDDGDDDDNESTATATATATATTMTTTTTTPRRRTQTQCKQTNTYRILLLLTVEIKQHFTPPAPRPKAQCCQRRLLQEIQRALAADATLKFGGTEVCKSVA